MTQTTPRPCGALTLRVLAALLGYPDATVRGHLAEMRALLRQDEALRPARLREVEALITTLERSDPLDIEAAYVELFDRGRATSLHLFEHVHGDSRDRGPAMIDLGQTYARAGLDLKEGELPDYLPAVLEFASTQPAREAKAFLGEIAHLLNAIFGALDHHGTAYASVLAALLELGGQQVKAVKPVAERPLDETWAEPAAFDGCSTQGQARPGDPQPVHVIRRQSHAQGAIQ
jgi:nitrate reductase delta subunit